MALLVREGGKTIGNAQSDLREAVDHLRYAAAEARRQFAAPRVLKGPTGELNELSLHGRGVFCRHLSLELPARHLHRADRGRSGSGQRGGG